jgi:adhesin/invasin
MVANSAVAQTGVAGTAVAARPSVIVRDLAGNPVPGVAVTFTATGGGGTVVGSPATTDAAGVATVTSWTLGAAAGTNTVVASAQGLPSVTFLATGGAGAAASVFSISVASQVGVQGTNVASRPTVRVTDANGNRVSGVTVVFEVTSGGGSVSGATQVTDAAGEASVASWTLGNQAPNTLSATVAGENVTGNPVVFTAQAATKIVVTSAVTPQTLALVTITVQLQDAANAPVSLAGIPLTIAIASGGGAFAAGAVTTVSTNSTGTATFSFTMTGTPGARTFTISGAGLTGVTTISITLN